MKRFLIARTVAYFALAILISALAGCTNNENTGSTGALNPPGTPGGSPLESLAKSMRAQLSTKSFRARISSSNPNMPGETVVEYVAPDRLRMTNPVSEMIAVGADTYTRQAGGQWQKAPINANEMAAKFRDPKLIDELEKNYNVALVGPDTLDGVPMMVYEYTPKSPTPQTPAGKTKVWIGTDDSLPRKI
ncbi:MAG TPA: hypothetical protein VJ464_02865, partial [Blastocatellia bacterium]|nr:hypothetical protein [Blastocatellia bacterium]